MPKTSALPSQVCSAPLADSHSKPDDLVFEASLSRFPLVHKLTAAHLLPTPAIVPKPKPKIGETVYAMNKNALTWWLQGTIADKTDSWVTGEVEYIVHYEPTNKKGRPVKPRGVMKPGAVRYIRQLTLKQMAYNTTCPFILPVGTRVIAKFGREMSSESSRDGDGEFYSGIVAEGLKPITKHRYLVFFDDGSAQYVHPEDVLLVYQASIQVWNDVHPHSYDFIKNYVIKYPDWPLVRLAEGSLVPVEWNGTWFLVRVLQIDYSLAKVQYESDQRIEWIYRGSGRFRPAKKYEQTDSFSTVSIQDADDMFVEYQGSIKKAKVPDHVPKPKPFQPHKCNLDCVPQYVPCTELNKLSPLAIPLFLGWTREITDSPQKALYYLAPCGMKLRNYGELNKYLQRTKSNIPVDFFCFDLQVNILDEFVATRILLKVDDLSQGKEMKPVQVINSLDKDMLPSFEYITESVASPGVDINTNDEFLMGCDCTDNCKFRSGCHCWKLPKDGSKIKKRLQKCYKNRRLLEYTVGGIYECNNRCPCKMTCPNRVVQAGGTWPLQIFKTLKKGWGLRALHDMPKGSFICKYSGEILTDAAADKAAKIHGSVYYANLNYFQPNSGNKNKGERKGGFNPIRFVGPRNKDCHVVDGRVKGNVGRFINHSCDPNVFIQNVFINNHDVRFPALAFFTTCFIRAGSELVFDYGYEIGCVPGKVMYCSCDTPYCRGRLL